MTDAALLSNHTGSIAELITEATMDALNNALTKRGIDADQIVAILPVAPQTLVTIAPEKFRVLYRRLS